MDISEITKVASRKRVNADADKLREKVSRETAKIIKLKVAQDTAYWDVKEKLHQLENNHERLQQNMVEVQMQHEAISGQYQDELRLRPETLNKLNSTREICDVLEDYSSRLKETLFRCKADQGALCDAYQQSGALVRDIKHKQLHAAESHSQLVQSLQEKVKLTTEHQEQLMQVFTSSKQQSDAEVSELKCKLETAQGQREELFHAVSEFGRKLDAYKFELDKKEDFIASLNSTKEQLTSQINEMDKVIDKLQNAIKESEESNEGLKKALTNQEAFTKTVCEQNNGLQEKISTLEEEQVTLVNVVKELQIKLEDAKSHREHLNKEVTNLNEKKAELENVIVDKQELLKSLDSEYQDCKKQLTLLETEKEQLNTELNTMKEESSAKSVKIEEFITKVQELETKIADMEVAMNTERQSTAEKFKELTTTIDTKDKELENKHSSINQLMSEVKNGSDARTKLEGTLQKVKRELELETESAREREKKLTKQVEQLEVVVRDKDDELTKQMNIILEMRNEKERLQEKIQTMQNTIDNIQKELTGKAPAHCTAEPPELDDNAVMYPGPKPQSRMEPPQAPSPKLQKLTEPRPAPRASESTHLDSMLFNLLSDTSMDGDTLDPKEVNRRFEALARGDRMSPLPVASLKRKAVGGLKYKNVDDVLPLSQVKNDIKNKERFFFKNKRIETKGKKK